MQIDLPGLLILGFDGRQPPGAGAPAWSSERRERFLIKPEVAAPLSVDRSVWPRPLSLVASGTAIGLWPSVLGVYSDLLNAPEAAVVIEIAVFRSGLINSNIAAAFTGTLRTDLDRVLKPQFETYGYDIADDFMLSGLNNCELAPDELARLRATWSAAINRHGLFEDLEDAHRYSTVCDAVIPEHAPFMVYRIRRVVAGPQTRA